MNKTTENLVRAAQVILTRLLELRRARWRLLAERLGTLPDRREVLAKARKRLAICAERGYDHAARRCLVGVESALRDLAHHLQEVQRTPWADSLLVPSMRDLLQDLRQLEDEFGGVKYKPQDKTVSVTTDPITLEDVALGPFEIILHLQTLADAQRGATYEVLALNPNPAASNDAVTHPHVSDGSMCPGDGGAAIQAALRSGRICDFFVMVRSVLTHYNPGSPFVRLEDWHGVSCYDCGYVMDPDDSRWCRSCENDFCSDCASYCICCDQTTCNGCLEECAACAEQACKACMSECPDCGRRLCRLCLDDDLCPCHEEDDVHENHEDQENQEGENQTVGTVVPTGAPVLTHGVGQVAVPAGSG